MLFQANYFGILELHQIRGRLGRFKQKNNLYLCTNNINEKIKFFVSNHEAKKILKFDLKNRGFGNLLGTEQHGHLYFHFFSQKDLLEFYISVNK